MKAIKFLPLALAITAFASSCKKDKESTPDPPPGSSPYYIRMTDAPAAYMAVNVDIQAVEITGNGSTVMLNTNAGVYNLLDLSNGQDTLIATGSLTISKVEQIRLILGPNNSITTTGGITYSLNTPSAQQSGLKLQVHQTLEAGVAYYVLLDFDANQSIVEQGNGSYSLKPVIRTIETALSGSIKGKVSQAGVLTTVTASSGPNSYSTIVNAQGEFIISGLPPGTYALSVNPVTPFSSSTHYNIVVTVGNTTQVGVIAI